MGEYVHPKSPGKALRARGYSSAKSVEIKLSAGDVSIVQATLDSIGGDKIFVGHSYGGFVISNAAVGRADVLGLLYTAAYVPDTGDTIESMGAGYVPPAFLAPGHLVFAPCFPYVIIDPQFFREDFAQDLNPKRARGDGSIATPDEPRAPRHSIGTRRLAQSPVVVRRVWCRSGDRPGPPALHGAARWSDHDPVPRREPCGRVHALCGTRGLEDGGTCLVS